eukprot:TRINITY_DN12803_c0_g1_i4.p1 TRINITY_DN12803_c0_g1~~TRINITY_DN12803_c0_g1_i4.p1  ORF type:complete len:214 (+),score=61.46 TRINITY_DN12803_c0_g1_i4:90-644(+)
MKWEVAGGVAGLVGLACVAKCCKREDEDEYAPVLKVPEGVTMKEIPGAVEEEKEESALDILDQLLAHNRAIKNRRKGFPEEEVEEEYSDSILEEDEDEEDWEDIDTSEDIPDLEDIDTSEDIPDLEGLEDIDDDDEDVKKIQALMRDPEFMQELVDQQLQYALEEEERALGQKKPKKNAVRKRK